jgi:hypothetical protein
MSPGKDIGWEENLRDYGVRHDMKLDESAVLQREAYTLSLLPFVIRMFCADWMQ